MIKGYGGIIMYTTYNILDLEPREADLYRKLRQETIAAESFAGLRVETVFKEFPSDVVQKVLLGFSVPDIKRIRTGEYVEDKLGYIGIDIHFLEEAPALFDHPWLRLGFPLYNPDYITIRAGTGISIVHDGGLLGFPLALEDYKRVERHPEYLEVARIIGSYPDERAHLQLMPSHLPIMDSDRVTWRDSRIEVIPATAFPYVWQNLQKIRA